MRQPTLTFTLGFIFFPISEYIRAETYGDAQLVYEWTSLDFDWPSEGDREQAIENGTFVPERNLIAGLKIYKDNVYVSVPRWRFTSGQPVTLARVVTDQGQARLRPYPSWAAQRQGDCQALQYVQSMEIDPNTGLMYVIDTGRVGIAGSGTPLNLCPPKLVVYDLNTDTQIDSYQMPSDVVGNSSNFMNDLVLHYVEGKVRYAYISDVLEARMHVFDFVTRTAHNFEDPSMQREGVNGSTIHINGRDYDFSVGIDGIAISPDFDYVYYSALGGYSLYQVPTSSLRYDSPVGSAGPRLLGRKVSQSDGLAYGSRQLYYGVLSLNAVYTWNPSMDMATQNVSIDQVVMKAQREVVRDDVTMQWADTFAFDNKGWLWFVSNRLHRFSAGSLNFTGTDDANMRIWKVYVNETGYLYEADRRTAIDTAIVG